MFVSLSRIAGWPVGVVMYKVGSCEESEEKEKPVHC